jgi:hypothetical protein
MFLSHPFFGCSLATTTSYILPTTWRLRLNISSTAEYVSTTYSTTVIANFRERRLGVVRQRTALPRSLPLRPHRTGRACYVELPRTPYFYFQFNREEAHSEHVAVVGYEDRPQRALRRLLHRRVGSSGAGEAAPGPSRRSAARFRRLRRGAQQGQERRETA